MQILLNTCTCLVLLSFNVWVISKTVRINCQYSKSVIEICKRGQDTKGWRGMRREVINTTEEKYYATRIVFSLLFSFTILDILPLQPL